MRNEFVRPKVRNIFSRTCGYLLGEDKMKRFWPFIFIISVWLIFVLPYYFSEKTPFPSTYQVNSFPLWSYYPEHWGPVKNGAMPDIIVQIFPWKHFTIENLKNGIIPFWNPNSFSGNPHVANFQTAAFSPFNILFFILPFVDAWTLLIFLQPILASVFMYLFMRSVRVSELGSLFASIAFMFSGFMVVWMAYGTLSYSILLLPLTLYSINKFQESKKVKFAFLMAASIAVSIFSGHFQTSLYLLLFSLAYLLFVFFLQPKKNILIFLPFIAGLLLSLPQLLPSIEFYSNTIRSGRYIVDGGIPFQYLVTLFSPDFFGNPVTRNDWFGYYAEWASFVGIIPFILALYSFNKKNIYSLFFIFTTIIILFLLIDSPIQKIIGNLKIPVLSTSTPSRIVVLLSFSLAVLAGMGYDNLKKLTSGSKKIFIPLFITGLLIVSVWVLILFLNLIPLDKNVIAKRNMIIPSALFLLFLLFTIIIYLKKNRKLFFVLSLLLLFFASYDSLRYVKKWMPFDSKSLVFINLPIVPHIKENLKGGRLFGNLEAQIGTFYNIPLIEGYDPLYVGRYGEFVSSAVFGEFARGERSAVKIDRLSPHTNRVLDLLGVGLVFNPKADTNQTWAYPVWKDKERNSLIYQDDKFELYKNNQSINRPTLFYDFEIIKSDKGIIKRFYAKDFDYRNKLILEKNPGNFKITKGTGEVRIERESSNSIRIAANSTSPSILFLSDNYYPGWRVKVNGKEKEILRANYSFRAVAIPEGKNVVDFYYFPLSFYMGLYGAAIGVLILVVLSVVRRLQRI